MTKCLVQNREDLDAFTIYYTIGDIEFIRALCDLGASINLMPLVVFKMLYLGTHTPMRMRLLMVD